LQIEGRYFLPVQIVFPHFARTVICPTIPIPSCGWQKYV
jgi:hypothetical protein